MKNKHSKVRDSKWEGRSPESEDNPDITYCDSCGVEMSVTEYVRQKGLCSFCLATAEDVPPVSDWFTTERVSKLAALLYSPNIQDLTVVVLALRDIEKDECESAMARLAVDADKIRVSCPELYEMINEWHFVEKK